MAYLFNNDHLMPILNQKIYLHMDVSANTANQEKLQIWQWRTQSWSCEKKRKEKKCMQCTRLTSCRIVRHCILDLQLPPHCKLTSSGCSVRCVGQLRTQFRLSTTKSSTASLTLHHHLVGSIGRITKETHSILYSCCVSLLIAAKHPHCYRFLDEKTMASFP